jgi:hypothetical protein
MMAMYLTRFSYTPEAWAATMVLEGNGPAACLILGNAVVSLRLSD